VLQDYWQGKTHQDEVLANLPQINRLAEKQGVLHRGGISMSGDGHIIPNHDFVLEVGYGVCAISRNSTWRKIPT
jgi:formate C-acetyltransferase